MFQRISNRFTLKTYSNVFNNNLRSLIQARSSVNETRAFIPEQIPEESLESPITPPQYCEYPGL